MDVLITDPPWVNGPHNAMQGWLRTVVRRHMLRYACRRPVSADDLVQDAYLKVLSCGDGRHSADLKHTLILRLVRDLTLFLSALRAIREALTFVAVTPPRLGKLRDKIKSLNLPLRLIPQSLHPIHTHRSPVGG